MRETAKIICESGKCEWQGGNVALIIRADSNDLSKPFNLGGIRVRMIKPHYSAGMPYDELFVMREGRLARLAQWYAIQMRRVAFKMISFDVWLYKLIGRPLADGCMIPKLSVSFIVQKVSL